MKLNLLLVVLSLFVSSSIYAEEPIKLLFHFNDTEQPLEFIATTVDSITFAGIAVEPENPEDPDKPDTPVNPEDPNKYENGYEYVDLGLSVMWATCNVGAKSPEEMGDSYSWGGTKPYKISHTYDDYTYDEEYPWKDENGYTKYNSNPEDGIVDNKTKLDLEDDAAHIKMGGEWRIPTIDEIRELFDNCVVKLTKKNGISGLSFTASNGNSIFMPSFTMCSDDYLECDYLNITRSSELGVNIEKGYYYSGAQRSKYFIRQNSHYVNDYYLDDREVLLPIRGVFNSSEKTFHPEPKAWVSGNYSNHDYVDIGLSVMWATCNLGSPSKTALGLEYKWAYTTPYIREDDNLYDYEDETTRKYDHMTTLAKEDDAATASWGSDWRTPTFAEFIELREKCIWYPVVIEGTKGYQITGPNGNAIFLPFEEYIKYMSSEGVYGLSHSTVGHLTLRDNMSQELEFSPSSSSIFYNRPVFGKHTYVTLRLETNNEVGEIVERTDIKGTDIDLSKYIFTRTGYVFTGWNTHADGTGISFGTGDYFTLTENTILYAQWTKLTESNGN